MRAQQLSDRVGELPPRARSEVPGGRQLTERLPDEKVTAVAFDRSSRYLAIGTAGGAAVSDQVVVGDGSEATRFSGPGTKAGSEER